MMQFNSIRSQITQNHVIGLHYIYHHFWINLHGSKNQSSSKSISLTIHHHHHQHHIPYHFYNLATQVTHQLKTMVIKTEGKIKEKKEEVLKGIEAEEKILEYLIQQNRPYNATDLAANLRVIKKVEVIRSLNHLFENQKILMKSFGKQQIYCCLQSEEITESPEELQINQIELSKGKEELKLLKDENILLESQLNRLRNEPTSTQLSIVKETLIHQVKELEEKVINLKTHSSTKETPDKLKLQSKEETIELNSKLEKFKSIYQSRKKIAKEVIKTVTENIEDEEIRNSFEVQVGIEMDDPELIELIQFEIMENRPIKNPSHSGHSGSGSKKRGFSDHLR